MSDDLKTAIAFLITGLVGVVCYRVAEYVKARRRLNRRLQKLKEVPDRFWK